MTTGGRSGPKSARSTTSGSVHETLRSTDVAIAKENAAWAAPSDGWSSETGPNPGGVAPAPSPVSREGAASLVVTRVVLLTGDPAISGSSDLSGVMMVSTSYLGRPPTRDVSTPEALG